MRKDTENECHRCYGSDVIAFAMVLRHERDKNNKNYFVK